MSTKETLPPPEKMNRALVDICHVALAWETDLPIREILLKLAQDAIPTTAQIMIHKTLQDRLAEVERELAGISAALDKEFGPQDTRSGDLLDDMGCFIDHHKAKEKELTQLKESNAELMKDKERLDWLDDILRPGDVDDIYEKLNLTSDSVDLRDAIDTAKGKP